jgi:hypothetical protein
MSCIHCRTVSVPNLLRAFRVGRVQLAVDHQLAAVLAGALGVRLHDVEEDALDWHHLEEFLRVRLHEFGVRRVEAELAVEAGLERLGPDGLARRVHNEPLGMRICRVVIPLHGRVDRDADVARVAGLDLLLQQLALDVRMLGARETPSCRRRSSRDGNARNT